MKKTTWALCIASALSTPAAFATNLVGEAFVATPQTIVSKVDGVMSSAPLELGEPVLKQQLVASIETQDFEFALEKQQANVNLASADLVQKQSIYERYQELSSKNSLAINDLDIAKAQYLTSKASLALAKIELKEAKQALEDTQITTSISGFIVSSSVESGDWVSKGDALYQVINIDQISVRLYASEYDINSLQIGQSVTLWAETAPSQLIKAQISRIGVQLDPNTKAYPIEIDIENQGHQLKPGMSIHATTDSQ
ncbi:efflux RND transporter periplasmic adaptor subunit [Vibrio sp. SCSIO 43136]|uniref:efflux RND transporter periplasmic adaptor subunit n=1 Tax=Vibrio sp. SCSIO 43136 TaxID=2819101 RepID=UPI0020754B4F|nr:efflux RND transporter periplasmic adaptor subunit [Vibrio sp. SCSIO 43136]USD67555.1 efflux RND transporter periplasmic adaptor subunit [Vibrio sp. SCSIO 43136]